VRPREDIIRKPVRYDDLIVEQRPLDAKWPRMDGASRDSCEAFLRCR
jgi:hypothetical protein